MLRRFIFAVIALFWVTMIVLLWRSEFGRSGEIASQIPADKVWEKILTAPDSSSLEILHHKKKIGYCRWSTTSGDENMDKVLSEDFDPDTMSDLPLDNYTIEVEGNINLKKQTNSVRFDLRLQLSTNQTWQEFTLRISMRPNSWEISSKAQEQTLHLAVNDENGDWEQTYKFSDLQNPEVLMQEFGGPLAVGLISSLGLRPSQQKMTNLSLGLKWEAHNHLMQFGHSKVRVYRLEARLLDRYKIFIFVSRVGEILWVHLPDEIVLSNDAFTHF